MNYTIEKDIPVPLPHNRYAVAEERKKREDYTRFIFAESMDIGDSALVPSDAERSGLRHYLLNVKRLPWKLKSRSVQNGIRIWRIK